MQEKGFFAALLDFYFTEFITTRIIPIVYMVGCALAVLVGLTIIVGGLLSHSAVLGMVSLILGPLVAFLYILGMRIGLEMSIAIFRIAEHTKEIVEQGRSRGYVQPPQM